jgi:hypothetical protein
MIGQCLRSSLPVQVRQSRGVPVLRHRLSDAALLERPVLSLDMLGALEGRLEGPIIYVIDSPHQGEQLRGCTARAEALGSLAPTTGETRVIDHPVRPSRG